MSHQSKALKLKNTATSVYSKSLLVAIAALALTATGAQAFTGDTLVQAGLTENQRAAFEVARELRLEGDLTGARNLLVDAGIDETVIERVRTVLFDAKHKSATLDSQKLRHRLTMGHQTFKRELTAAQEAAFFAAQSANDRDTMEAILEEAGIQTSKSGHGPQTMRDGRVLN